MKLITKELEQRFADIGNQDQEPDPIVVAKFFDPSGSATWFVTEYDPETQIAHGYVKGLVAGDWNDEWGNFSIKELESVRKSPLGLGIERDLYFDEKPISEAVPELKPSIEGAKRALELESMYAKKDKEQTLSKDL